MYTKHKWNSEVFYNFGYVTYLPKDFDENKKYPLVLFLHGAVGTGEIYYNTIYWNRLREKILAIRNYVPVNVINAGIGGDKATQAINRMDKQVFCHLPDLFMEKACELAEEMNVPVCDCYSMWKELSKTQDTTKLLANHINHPTREMHELFAESLFRMIFKDTEYVKCSNDSVIYEDENGRK